jgi:trehalose synthase-fused probable maltokinase
VIDAERLVAGIAEERLLAFISEQRWFGAKSREVAHARVLEAVVARSSAPLLVLALVEMRFPAGTHEVYHLPVGLRPAADGWSHGVVCELDGWTAYDALFDAELAREVVRLIGAEATLAGEHGRFEFRTVAGAAGPVGPLEDVRPMGVEQSNTSVVFDDRIVLKLYRRVEAGINPELELLRFLTERGFAGIPPLEGWAEHSGRLMDATLAILQRYVPGDGDGWSLALESLGADGDSFLGRVRRLGEVTGRMHSVLGSDPADPAFAPEEPSAESIGLLTATIDEEIEQVFAKLPDRPELEPIAGRGEEVREQLRLRSRLGPVGLVIRHHGDYHLGQVLWTGDDWIVIDFEGEPARSLPERRRKRSPLRDVAGMLRSFAYVASATAIERGGEPPPGWEDEARRLFMEGYLEAADARLLPHSEGLDRLLAIFELEKAVYELRYELDNRPGWAPIPVAGILRLLESA